MSGTQGNYTKSLLLGLFTAVAGGIIVVNYEHRTFDDKKADQVEKPTDNQSVNSLPPNSTNKESNDQHFTPSTQSKSIKPQEVDYTSFVNTSLSKAEVSVIVVDEKGSLLNSVSSDIGEVYQKAGKSTSVGLLKSAFVRKPQFQELSEGNSEIIQKLNLGSYADYLAVGRINFEKRPGSLVSGTFVCTASISMIIISIAQNSLKRSFTISNANGNGATESQAKEDALQKLLDRYYSEHSAL